MTHSGGKPHTNVGDRGQRYEVTFEDPMLNLRRVLGWSETLAGAEQMARGIKAHPSWCNPEIKDRNPVCECGKLMTYDDGEPMTRHHPGEPPSWFCENCGLTQAS